MSRIAFSACACHPENSAQGTGTSAFTWLAKLSKVKVRCQEDCNVDSQASLSRKPSKQGKELLGEKRRKMKTLTRGPFDICDRDCNPSIHARRWLMVYNEPPLPPQSPVNAARAGGKPSDKLHCTPRPAGSLFMRCSFACEFLFLGFQRQR